MRTRDKVFKGKVVSTSMDKTITVLVETKKAHPLYSKRIITTKKYKAHDEEGKANVGDIVKIIETKPYSKTKYFRLLEIKEKAQEV
jgi:small subunit ribosomal protein S17